MGKLKQRSVDNKIKGKGHSSTGCVSAQMPWFSFRDLTNNAHYNLKALNEGKETEDTLSGLNKKLIELSQKPWLYWQQQPKQIGFETIPYGEISFAARESATLSKDTSLYVFRFDTYRGSKQGRIIGYKDAPCAVMHIIGYDLDFTAYGHG